MRGVIATSAILLIAYICKVDVFKLSKHVELAKARSVIRIQAVLNNQSPTPSKIKSDVFFCDNCGVEHIKWVGKCSSCGEWNTVKVFKGSRGSQRSAQDRAQDIRSSVARIKMKGGVSNKEPGIGESQTYNKWLLNDHSEGMIAMDSLDIQAAKSRIKLFSQEMNRVMSGGLVPGSVSLLAGEPGIGKSTLLIQMASHLASNSSKNIIYLSGEETAEQIASRADRLKLSTQRIYFVAEVEIESLIDMLMAKSDLPSLLIIDSIQTVYTSSCPNSIGSVTQIRESTSRLVQFAKLTGVSVLLIGHVTKSGDIAGPRVLEHMVDTVLNLEGNEHSEYRLLRNTKNRFGSTSEIGVFTMTATGLEDVTNASEIFLSSNIARQNQEGSSVVATMEGTRPILAEVQSLVGSYIPPNIKANSRRTIEGYSLQRMLLICAVLEKTLKLLLHSRDIYVNIVGGLKISEPAADLAVAATIVSSYLNLPIRKNIVFVGEIGLGGELRTCRNAEARILEAANMGFDEIIVPKKNSRGKIATIDSLSKERVSRLVVRECVSVKDALAIAFDVESIDQLIERKKSFKRSNLRNSQEEDECTNSEFD